MRHCNYKHSKGVTTDRDFEIIEVRFGLQALTQSSSAIDKGESSFSAPLKINDVAILRRGILVDARPEH